jgi:hypothetical protein
VERNGRDQAYMPFGGCPLYKSRGPDLMPDDEAIRRRQEMPSVTPRQIIPLLGMVEVP